MLNLDDNLFIEYLAESREQLATVESDLLAIEKDGSGVAEERADRVFRLLHTVKGGSGFFDLVTIGELAHQIEAIVGLIRTRQLAPAPECVSVLLRAVDCLSALVENPATSNQSDISEPMAELAGLQADRNAYTPKSKLPTATEPQQHDNPLRVLLVEDDFACRLLLQTFLSRYGDCHVAVNGREAVDAYRAALKSGQGYDLICMDIMMPEMDGREAVRAIRAMEEAQGILFPHGTRIFMTTTANEIREVFLCYKEFCDAYLLKPIDLGQLLSRMKLYQLVN